MTAITALARDIMASSGVMADSRNYRAAAAIAARLACETLEEARARLIRQHEKLGEDGRYYDRFIRRIKDASTVSEIAG